MDYPALILVDLAKLKTLKFQITFQNLIMKKRMQSIENSKRNLL
jgi:hypothetical protein